MTRLQTFEKPKFAVGGEAGRLGDRGKGHHEWYDGGVTNGMVSHVDWDREGSLCDGRASFMLDGAVRAREASVLQNSEHSHFADERATSSLFDGRAMGC